MMKTLTRRESRADQIRKRLDSIQSTDASVADADPAETEERLRRLRYENSIRNQGTPALDLGG